MEDELIIRHAKYLTFLHLEQYKSRTFLERLLKKKLFLIGDSIRLDWPDSSYQYGYICKKTYTWFEFWWSRDIVNILWDRRGVKTVRKMHLRIGRCMTLHILRTDGEMYLYEDAKIKMDELRKDGLFWASVLNAWVY